MSLTAVRPFIRSVANSKGFREWTDAFNIENIPSTILNKSYHIANPTFNGVRLNQLDQEVESNVELKLIFKGYRNPADAIDTAISDSENLLKEMLKPANRVGQAGVNNIKNVVLDSIGLEQFDISNDNVVVATVNLTIFVIIKTN